MKPTIKSTTVQSNGIKDSVSFGIKASGLHHVLGILRDQLYSNKILANVREYTTNAVDAHTEAGLTDRPIEVSLPNRMSPYFKVRDFGFGLSDEDIHNVYAFYGESTKRNSNEMTGMLGIGSKSAFAYGDNFVINSFVDGKKHSYNAYIDDSQVGQISKLSTEDSNEERGIEIIVPVKSDDHDEFRNEAYNLFRYFKVKPIVKGVAEFKYDEQDILFSGDDWSWSDGKTDRYDRGKAVAVMGNIGYPLDEHSINIPRDDDHVGLSTLLCENLTLNVDIGDVEISASRENLQYTDYTRKQIIKKLKKVRDEIKDVVMEQFKDAKTMFEAKCLYGSVFDYGSPLYALREVLKKELTFNGKEIEGEDFQFYGLAGVEVSKFAKSYRGHQRYKREDCNRINCDNKTVIIENDMGHNRGLLGKILPIIFDKKQTPYIVHYTGESKTLNDGSHKVITPAQAKGNVKKKLGFDAPVLKLSELPKKPLADYGYAPASRSGSSDGSKNKKHSASAFEFNLESAKTARGWGGQGNSEYYNVVDVDLETDAGVYTIIDKFLPTKLTDNGEFHQEFSVRSLANILDALEQLGVKLPTIHAFKIKQKDKVVNKDNWTSVWDWAEAKLKEQIDAKNLKQMYVDREYALKFSQRNNDHDIELCSYFYDWLEKPSYTQVRAKLVNTDSSLFVEFADKFRDMMLVGKKSYVDSLREVSKQLNQPLDFKDIKPSADLVKLAKKMLKRYGMLETVNSNNWAWNDRPEFQKTLTNYVNVIDVCTIAKDKLPTKVL